MKILFLDQTGKLGGAEMSLMDIVKVYQASCSVGLFEDGPFRSLLEQQNVLVQILSNEGIQVRKNSSFIKSLSSIGQVIPLIAEIIRLGEQHDVIYANTSKALVLGAIASAVSKRPLIYHLRDILSEAHFSLSNRRLLTALSNLYASVVITNSEASRSAFIKAGGRQEIAEVVYNGFEPERYQHNGAQRSQTRQELGLADRFVVGHFSRLSPWKGQHILIDALLHCEKDVTALLVGDALFGEQQYVKQLHQQVEQAGLQERVKFLGFRSDVPQLMNACDLVAHTSTAPEPFGRVIVEAMLCGVPVVASGTGGAVELVEHERTGWLVPPDHPIALSKVIHHCVHHPHEALTIAQQAQAEARNRFHLTETHRQIDRLVQQVASGWIKKR